MSFGNIINKSNDNKVRIRSHDELKIRKYEFLEICEILDKEIPRKKSYSNLITFVDDRPGHDFRYAIDASRINKELKWSALINFEIGLKKTINWYIANRDWWEPLKKRFETNKRIGIKK